MFLETLKRHDFELGKGNYVVIKRDKKYLLKAFSGFKRKHLKSEFEIRQKLKGIEFPGVDFNEFFESCNFTYLSIPYIWNNGNLEGREEKFFKEINEILIRFHSIPKELFFDRNSYRIFNKNLFSEEKYPYSFKNLNQNAKGDIKRLFLKEVGRLKKFGKKPSHNDFNGDNLLLSRSGNIFITDFETCYLNFELEDFSRLYFFNTLRNNVLFEKNKIYVSLLSKNKNIDPLDLDIFLLYQALRFNEYLGGHKSKLESSKGKGYKSFLERILDETFRRNLR